MIDNVKLLVAALLVVGGVAAFYFLDGYPALVRVLAVVAGLIAGAVVVFFSAPGKAFYAFAGEAREEARKVVWPTRKETMQTTGIVLLFVFVMAVFLWLVDSSLLWLVGVALDQGN